MKSDVVRNGLRAHIVIFLYVFTNSVVYSRDCGVEEQIEREQKTGNIQNVHQPPNEYEWGSLHQLYFIYHWESEIYRESTVDNINMNTV